jgi:hypothetical protein
LEFSCAYAIREGTFHSPSFPGHVRMTLMSSALDLSVVLKQTPEPCVSVAGLVIERRQTCSYQSTLYHSRQPQPDGGEQIACRTSDRLRWTLYSSSVSSSHLRRPRLTTELRWCRSTCSANAACGISIRWNQGARTILTIGARLSALNLGHAAPR